MKIEPKILNNVCITTHPAGCIHETRRQIDWVRSRSRIEGGPKNVLVIGSSAGFGLASRISLAFGGGAATVGVGLEKGGQAKRPGTPGYYCSATFDYEAAKAGLKSVSLNTDAFSDEAKTQVVEAVRSLCPEGLDLIIYSLASPRRTDPKTGQTYHSVLKPIGSAFESLNVDFMSGEVSSVRIEPASAEEIEATVKVMGGEDWILWMEALQQAGVLARGVETLAYSYIGPEVTFPIYAQGTIGKAKEHLLRSASELTKQLEGLGGHAYISVNKALVTRASSVIPVVPLYISLLYRVMKENSSHEECIEQMHRLMTERLYNGSDLSLDSEGRIRIDDWEMDPKVQAEVAKRWLEVNNSNIGELADLAGFRESYLRVHGFGIPGIDYEKDVDPLALDLG